MEGPFEDRGPKVLLTAVAELRRLDYVPPAHVDLLEKVGLAQWRARSATTEGRLYPPISASAAGKLLRHGFYLVDFARFKLDSETVCRFWADLCSVMAEFGELSPARADRLHRAVDRGRLSPIELAGIVFRGERAALARLAQRVRVPGRTLGWLAVLLLRPYLVAAAQELAEHVAKYSTGEAFWPHPYCPVCGHEPLMALTLRSGGRRQVECSLCATRWDVHRARCVFCGNSNSGSLKFFYYDSKSPYRVDVCDKCRRYIKVADERNMPAGRKPLLLAEDIATVYLDVLARRKRYVSPWSALPGDKPTMKEVMDSAKG